MVQLQTEKDTVCLEREELRAEVVLSQARLWRMEHLGATLESEETSGASSPTTPQVGYNRRQECSWNCDWNWGKRHPPLCADAPMLGPAEGPFGVRLEVYSCGEGSTLASGVSIRGSAVTTVISAASAPRSSVIPPEMSAATSSLTASIPSTVNITTGTPLSVGST